MTTVNSLDLKFVTREVVYKVVKPDDPFPLYAPYPSNLFIDVETYGGEYGDGLTIQSNKVRLVSTLDPSLDCVHVFDLYNAPPWKISQLMAYISSAECVGGHNLMFDLSSLIKYGLKYPQKVRCSMIAFQVLINGMVDVPYSLAALIKRYFNIELSKELQTSDWSRSHITTEQVEYLARDVWFLPDLFATIEERLEGYKLMPTYQLECGFMPAISAMSLNGINVDKKHWVERSMSAAERAGQLEKSLLTYFPLPPPEDYKVVRTTKKGEANATDVKVNQHIAERNASRAWNLASPIQVSKMFKEIGVSLPDTKYETLCAYKDRSPEIIEQFLRWRDLEKEATTFGLEWLNHAHPDGKIYPNWQQMRAATGRMSCSSPNMQQVPRGDCRKGIIAPDGCVLVRADFSQIEARVAAKISKCPVLTEIFQTGKDIHEYAAKSVLGKLSVSPEERQVGKSLVFGLLFSMSAPSLRVYCRLNYGVDFSEQEAEIFRDRFFRTFYGLARWHDSVRRVCNEAREFRTLLGRRRIVTQPVNGGHINMLGLALNTPVQGSAADMLKIAVREMWDCREEFPEARLMMLVHDEAVYVVPEARAQDAAVWIKGKMIEAGNEILSPIPCDASIKIGKSWGG